MKVGFDSDNMLTDLRFFFKLRIHESLLLFGQSYRASGFLVGQRLPDLLFPF